MGKIFKKSIELYLAQKINIKITIKLNEIYDNLYVNNNHPPETVTIADVIAKAKDVFGPRFYHFIDKGKMWDYIKNGNAYNFEYTNSENLIDAFEYFFFIPAKSFNNIPFSTKQYDENEFVVCTELDDSAANYIIKHSSKKIIYILENSDIKPAEKPESYKQTLNEDLLTRAHAYEADMDAAAKEQQDNLLGTWNTNQDWCILM